MKKLFSFIALFFAFVTITLAQDHQFEIRTYVGEEGYLYVQMRETSGTGTPTTSNQVTDIVFQIKWLQSLGDVDMGDVICTSYNITKSGTRQTKNSYYYQEYYADNTPFAFPNDWTVNQWETIAKMEVTSNTSGTGTFEVGDNTFVATGVNIGIDLVDYTPTVNGSANNFDYPNFIWNYVWTGATGGPPSQHNGNKWEKTTNWDGKCPGDSPPEGSYPYYGQAGAYVLIPSGLTNYPELSTGGDAWGWACKKMLIENGAHVTVPDLSSANQTSPARLDVDGDLTVKGKLYLPAKGYATVSGSTEIDNAAGIEVQADATGVGSFINNGTITYGSSGSGKVQTYLANGASAGNFYFHTVGPTVDEENYTGSGTGAFLSAFNISPGNTYAYYWDETQDTTVSSAWKNIYSNTYEVHSGDGIALSTTDGTSHTLNMTGEFMTGDINPPALTHSTNNHYELISNPYPSSFDFDGFATDPANNGVIQNKYWVWDPAGGNYVARSDGSGGTQHLQVGQAFFVETKSAGTVTFKNSFRTHSSDAFRETNPNELTMKVSGGSNGYKDELIVRFVEEATFGYDSEIDAYKVNSMYEDATQIESIAEDGSELAINFLPVDALSGDMVSVPVNFQCGYTADYTFDFEGIESFENGNEIWLEDKFNNDSWIYLNNNPHYTFTAATYQPHDRFILHFFGPTSVNENSVEKPVEIFSYRQYAYVKKNEPGEIIKKVSVYNMSGEELFTKKVLDQPINKLWVSEHVGYYFVKVVTDKNIYTGKVFIFK
jgi:hypothetical protein